MGETVTLRTQFSKIATMASSTAKWNDTDPLPVCVCLDGGVCR
jgi:hypothetical protein